LDHIRTKNGTLSGQSLAGIAFEVDWQHIRPSKKEVEHRYAATEVSRDARRIRQ
jgi:hypothetical protein